MTEHITAKLPKWPFILGDIAFLTLAGIIVYKSSVPFGMWQMILCLVAVALGAGITIIPFLKEYQASVRMAEANTLAATVAQVKNIESVGSLISSATAQWTDVQQQSLKTITASRELADRMKAEAAEFCAFLEKANESEKNHLRLEIEKLRRAEGEWLQVSVRILDHVYALNQAGARSGQPVLISQLNQFQNACRDAARRVGLVPFIPGREDTFDEKVHQLAEEDPTVTAKSLIRETLATGFTYQGQLIRKALVRVKLDNQQELPLGGSPEKRIPSGGHAPSELRFESSQGPEAPSESAVSDAPQE